MDTPEMTESEHLDRPRRSIHRTAERSSSTNGFTAVIFGGRHIQTYDGLVYQIPGKEK